MVTAFQFAAELSHAAASAQVAAKRVALEAAHGIEQTWEAQAPVGPTGMTSSDPVNIVEPVDEGGRVGAEAANIHFVAGFLQRGTSKMSPKYDFLGAAVPHVEKWVNDLADEVGL